MRNALLFILLSAITIFSCKPDKRQQIIGKWHAVKLYNPGMDSFFANSQAYIDTIGKNNDAATNMALYGSTNMDSMRHLLQQQYDSAKNMQQNAIVNTIFNFRKDSVVMLSFSGALDSSKWRLNGNNDIVLADLNKAAGPGDTVIMHVLALSDTSLKLKFEENGSSSTVTFHKEN